MKSAKRAGWGCLLWSIVFVPFAAVFYWFGHANAGSPLLFSVSMVVFWWLVLVIAACLLYAVWGLICGHSPKAWERYERRSDAVEIDEAKRNGYPE